MGTRNIDFERDKLYQQVWTQPLTQVALLYGVTPMEVKSAAQALHIPLPPAGHWTKVEHGKGMATPPLPEFDGKTVHRLVKWVNEEAEEVARRFEAAQDGSMPEAKPLPEMRAAVAQCLPIIKKMAARLKNAHKDTRMWPSVSGMGHFELSVSPANQERALLTLDRVLRHCQAAGLTWNSDESRREAAAFVIDGSFFTMRIFESGRREERELTPKEKAAMKANPNGYHYLPDRYTFHPTDQLKLEVHNPKYRSIEFTVQDGAAASLADRIAEVPVLLRARALEEQLRQDVRAEERQRDDERRQAHARKLEVKRMELERLKHFEEAAENAVRAARLRSLAEAMETSGRFADDVGMEKLEWIRNAADWLDPTISRHWPAVDDVKDHYY